MNKRILELHSIFCRRQISAVRVVDGWRETIDGLEGTDAALLTSPAPTLADVDRVKKYVAAERDYLEQQSWKCTLEMLRFIPVPDVAARMKAQFNAYAEGKTPTLIRAGDWIYNYILHALPHDAFVNDDAQIDFRGCHHPVEAGNGPHPGVAGESDGTVIVPTYEEILAVCVAIRTHLSKFAKFYSGLDGMEPREIDRETYEAEKATVDTRLNELFAVQHACRMDAAFPLVVAQCAGLIYFNLRARGPVDCVGRADSSDANLALLKALEITEPDFEFDWVTPDLTPRLVNECIPGTEPFERISSRQRVEDFEKDEALVQRRMEADLKRRF